MIPTQESASCDYTVNSQYVCRHLDFAFLSSCVIFPVKDLKIAICCYCTMFVFERPDLCLQYIVCLCALPLIVASISFCETNDVLYSQLSLLDSESIVACVHPSLTYLMAGFCRRPAAQIEKFSVTKWNVWLCLHSRKIGDCSILIPDSISDVLHAAPKWISDPRLLTFQLPGRTMNEWILMNTKDVPRPFFPRSLLLLVWRWGEEERWSALWLPWERGTPLHIQNIPCEVQKEISISLWGSGPSFVCERCGALLRWLCQFFKSHLQ